MLSTGKLIAIGAALVAAYYYFFVYDKVSCTDGKYRVVTSKNCSACAALKAQAKKDKIKLVNETDVEGLDAASQAKIQHVPVLLHGCTVVTSGVTDVLAQLKKLAHTQ